MNNAHYYFVKSSESEGRQNPFDQGSNGIKTTSAQTSPAYSKSCAKDRDEQVIIVKYDKSKGDKIAIEDVIVERPIGNSKNDEIALCAAIGQILHGDLQSIDAEDTATVLATALTKHVLTEGFNLLKGLFEK